MMEIKIKELFKDIKIQNIKQINKGWSNDQKYLLKTSREKYLLRISEQSELTNKLNESNIVKRVSELGYNTPRFIEIKSDEQYVYQLYSYIDGSDAIDSIALLSKEQQYQLGLQAGVILNGIHSLVVDVNNESILEREKSKILQRVKRYQDSKYFVQDDWNAIEYIYQNIHLIDESPIRLCHGDYHLGNMIINQDKIGIIDFNRYAYEDIHREFVPMCIFSREESINFALGQLNGYFGDQVTNDFWQKVKIYLAYVTLFSVLWAEHYSLQDVEGMLKRKEMIYRDFDFFKREEPVWYK